jgi:hypothetical protein
MKTKTEKNHLIISEFGKQRRISFQKDLLKNIEISFKDFGLTKNDIILISSNDLDNKTNIILAQNNKENENLNEIKEDYYLFSLTNKCEIYKQEFENKLKSQIENNLFISSKDLLGDKLSYINNHNYNNINVQIQKEISHVQEVYTNFKSISNNINSNLDILNSLSNKNIININKSLSILYNYYKKRIKNIQINYETLKNKLDEVNKRVISNEKKIKNFFIIKMGIKDKEELKLFKILINEDKIKQLKEKINKNLDILKEKLKNKKKIFEEMINNMNDNNKNIENKMKNVIDEKKMEDIKNESKKIKDKFDEIKYNWNKNKFNEEIKKLIEKNYNGKEYNEDSFDINQRIDKLDEYKKEDELNIIIHNIKNIKNDSENILHKIKILIMDIIKKFFRFSSDIFFTLDNFELNNKKFLNYKNLLENIDKDNFDLLFSLDEALRFRFYFNEYERRIYFLKDLKMIIYKIKNSLIKENEIRQKFNEELKEYFKGKVNDIQFGISNNILSFFEWDDIKGNFDIYGDKYYTNIKLEEGNFISKNKNDSKISNINIEYINNIFPEDNYQQKMLYHLNNKILEYKSEINKLTNIIENKNNEFKQLKYNMDQINDLFNDLYRNIQNEKNDKNNNSEENSGIKKKNKIFNPLYDELNDEMNEEESFAIKDNDDSISSKDKIKINENNNNIFLTLEQTFIIKKTIFNYFTNILSLKNEEYNKLFSLYNSLKMSLEDK